MISETTRLILGALDVSKSPLLFYLHIYFIQYFPDAIITVMPFLLNSDL